MSHVGSVWTNVSFQRWLAHTNGIDSWVIERNNSSSAHKERLFYKSFANHSDKAFAIISQQFPWASEDFPTFTARARRNKEGNRVPLRHFARILLSLTNERVCRDAFLCEEWMNQHAPTHRQPSFVLGESVMKPSSCWRWRRRQLSLLWLQQHDTLLQVKERRLSRRAWWSRGLRVVRMEVDVVRVVDLDENVAGLRGDLEKAFLEIVRNSLLVVIVIGRPRTTQMNVIPKARWHFNLALSLTQISLSRPSTTSFIDWELMVCRR